MLAAACFSLLSAAAQAADSLLITEIQSDGVSDFWELTNTGTMSVALGGYKWNDSARTTSGAIEIPSGTSIAPGESVIFTGAAAATFRTQWGLAGGVQVLSNSNAPGFGMNDGVTLYNTSNLEVLYLSYGSGGFTRSNHSPAAGGHAGISAGGSAAQAMIWDSSSGTNSPRYTNATGSNFGTFTAPGGATNRGSPGYSGFSSVQPSVVLSVSVTAASFSESAANPASTGTVSRAVSTASDLVVNLASSDVTEATVPVTVTIPANQTSVTFPITVVDDNFPDGNKSVTITATAADATAGTAMITVEDDGDVLSVSLMLTEISSSASPGAPSSADDYWELTNFGSSVVNLNGYSWHDSGRSPSAAAAYALPAGSSIAPGESVIFTGMVPAAFRSWWGLASSIQVFQTSGAPGLGENDGVSFFDPDGNELFFFSYAAGGFTRENGTSALGGHAGTSAGASAAWQNIIWVPASGTAAPRYTFATGGNYGSFQSALGTDGGSPGMTVPAANVSIGNASVEEGNTGTSVITLNVTRSDVTTAFTVNYASTGGTAMADIDYTPLAAGILNFAAGGAATQSINITVNGDTTSEPDETVMVALSNVINTLGATVIGNATGIGTITNDDAIAPTILTPPANASIAIGTTTTLTVAVSGFPTPSIQWYQGVSGVTTTPVGTNSTSFTTPTLTTTTSYWARASNLGGLADSAVATIAIVTGPVSINLANYVRVGRYNLPEPTRTALPPGAPAHNLLGQEASGVAYNWDTDTLFIVGDGGRSVSQVSKTGQLIDTMTLALRAGAPQGTDFYDPEGITYIGGGQFVFTEERDRQLVRFTYAAGTTLARSGAQTVKLGTFDDNTGTEGLSWDPLTGGFIVLKEKSPIGVFQTNVDFVASTATNGSPTALNSTNLFATALLGMTDVADVFALSNLPSMSGQPQASHLLVLGQEDARVVLVDRAGGIQSMLNIASDPGNPLNAADQQHEGITMDRAGNIYIVNENGGGGIDFPQLWVYAPATGTNQAPTAVALSSAVTSLQENTNTTAPVKLADIVITDDAIGTNTLSLAGADAAGFQITGGALYLRAGTVLDFETKASYSVTVVVDDATVGATPDATVNFTLSVTDQVVEVPLGPVVMITEVAPWSSGESPLVAADWFEVTNVSANAVNISGWKVDDSSASFSTAIVLNGVTTLAPGESVIFLESSTGNPPAMVIANFKSVWFGSNVPAGLQVGTYQGSGIGLSTGGDAVNLYNATGALQANVTFGASDGTSPFQTFDNTAALNSVTLSKLSVAGVNGAFVATNSAIEIGSPGYSAPGALRVTEVAAWSSGNSPVGADWFEVTNIGARAVDITGWKVDDSSESFAAALALGGITLIAPGESVLFIETANLVAARTKFLSNWFGANPPADLQIGNYSGSGIGLSTGGDAVNLFDSNGTRRVNVAFGISPGTAPFATFDNKAGLNVGSITTLSIAGLNGAFAAVNSPAEVGSPGTINAAPTVIVPVSPVLATATGSGGASVTFAVSATDTEDGVLTPIATPANGSVFALGDTTVTVRATDSAGVTTTRAFVVRVQPGFTHPTGGQPISSLAAPLNLAASVTPVGGVFSGTGVTSAGVFDAGLVGPGTYSILYTVSGAGTTITITVAAPPVITPIATLAPVLSFDGVGRHVNTGPGLALAGTSFTIEFWAKRASAGTDHIAINQGLASAGTDRALFIGFRSTNVFSFGFYNDDLQTTATYTDTDWHHWACTYDAASRERRIYRDGVMIATDTTLAHFQGAGNFIIGANFGGSTQFFHGLLAEVRVWNIARNRSQIAAKMFDSPVGNEAGLTAFWPLDDGFGTVVLDLAVGHAHSGSLMGGSGWQMAVTSFGPLLVEINTPFIDPGATAVNGSGQPLAVTATHNVLVAAAGYYGVVYSASDSMTGLTGTVRRLVAVDDRTAPPPPEIVSPANGSTVTMATTVVSGLAEPGSTVVLTLAGPMTQTLTVTTSAGGQFETSALSLTDGVYSVTAVAKDESGNTSAALPATVFTRGSLPTVQPGILVTRGGLVLDRLTNQFVQSVTLKNTTTATISGPVFLVLDTLSGNATLTGATGVTARLAPLNSPYVQVVGANATIAANASVNATLKFANPTRAGITYITRVLAGGSVAP